MTRPHFDHASAAALALGLALAWPGAAGAQSTSGAGLSSGSGQGTGSGASSAIQGNDSGSVSGVGPGSTTGGLRGPDSGVGPRTGRVPSGPPGFSVPMGGGVSTSFPDDPSLFPSAATTTTEAGRAIAAAGNIVLPHHLEAAMRIREPEDRSLALQRTAVAAIFSNKLSIAHQALTDAARAALQVSDPLIRDLRLIAIITTLNNLSEAYLREGKADMVVPELEDTTSPLPRSSKDRVTMISRAEAEWRRGAHAAGLIANPTYRSEMLFRVIDSLAFGSQTVVNEYQHDDPSTAGKSGAADPVDTRADQLLVAGSQIATRIERPVWRDRALVSLAASGAASKQFRRALQIARMIPQPEVRTDALVKIAEAQARRDDPRGATTTYQEAAAAVASIPLDDPRAVLAGVLIDNLISVGRFDDARATIGLYPDTPRRLNALGAVAESQGMRGAADAARAWITRDVPPAYRSQLYRRVDHGVLTAIEQNRSRDLSNRER